MNIALPRILTCVGVAALLAACSSSPGAVPAPAAGPAGGPQSPQSAGSQIAASSAMRAVESKKTKSSGLTANPASVSFTLTDTAAKKVAISGERDGTYDVSIAGTGPCPAVSPASLKLAKVETKHDERGRGNEHGEHARGNEHGEHGRGHDNDDSDAAGVITVTPAAPGSAGGPVRGGGPGSSASPAQCVITVIAHDRDAGDDNAEHESEHGTAPLLIPVTVGGGGTPSPSPVPTATPSPAPTDTPAPTPSPTPTPCVVRGAC